MHASTLNRVPKIFAKCMLLFTCPKKSTSTRDPAPLCTLQSADIWFLRHIQHTLVIQLFVMGSTPAPPLSRKTVNGVLEISFTDIGWYFWIVMAIRSKWLSVCPWIYRWSWKSLNHTKMAGHQRHGWRFWHTKPLSKSHKELGHGLSALASCEIGADHLQFLRRSWGKNEYRLYPIIPVQFRFGSMLAPSVSFHIGLLSRIIMV